MSAKSSNFAAEMIKKMELKEMTHTCYRCRHSYFDTHAPKKKGGLLQCPYGDVQEGVCTCGHWRANIVTEMYFSGALHDHRKTVLTEIFLDRVKKGTF